MPVEPMPGRQGASGRGLIRELVEDVQLVQGGHGLGEMEGLRQVEGGPDVRRRRWCARPCSHAK